MQVEYISKEDWVALICKRAPQFVWTNEHSVVGLLLLQYINKDEDFELVRKDWYLKMAEKAQKDSFKQYLLQKAKTASTEYFYDLNRGIGLIGSPGVFKTTFFKVLQQVYNGIRDDNRRFSITPFRELIEKYKKDGEYVFEEYSKLHVMIDDFGFLKATEENVKYFGNEVNPIEYITTWRYRLFTDYNKKLFHFTSNLSWPEFQKRYEEYAYSRLEEMCNIIALESQNRRGLPKRTAPIPTIKRNIQDDDQPQVGVKNPLGNLYDIAERDGSPAAMSFLDMLNRMKAVPQKPNLFMTEEEKAKYQAEKFKYAQSAVHAKWEEFAKNTMLKEDARINALQVLENDAKLKGHTTDLSKIRELIQWVKTNAQ